MPTSLCRMERKSTIGWPNGHRGPWRTPARPRLGPHPAGRRGAQLEPAEVEDVEGDLVALADLAEQGLGGRPPRRRAARGGSTSRGCPSCAPRRPATARPRPFDEEGGEVLAVDLGEDDEEVGEAAVGDALLLAVKAEAAVGQARRACLVRQRVGARAGLAQAVGATVVPAASPGQVPLLLRVGAEEDRRETSRCRVVGAEGDREDARWPTGLGDDDRGHLVEVEAAVGLRHVDADAAESRPRIASSSRCAAQSLAARRSARGATSRVTNVAIASRDGRLLGREAFGGEDVGRIGRAEQPGAARRRSLEGRGHAAASTRAGCRPPIHSKIPAAPMPPPTHIVTRP